MEWIRRASEYRTLTGKRDLLCARLSATEQARLEELREQFAERLPTLRLPFNQREQVRAPVSVLVQFQGRHGTLKGCARDFSGEGAFVETVQPLPAGTRTVLQVSDRETGEEWRFGAEVTRVEENGMGLRFVGIPVAIRINHRASDRLLPLRHAA
jgi:hypothetical protein